MNTIVRNKFLFYLTFFLLVGNVQLYAQQKLKFAVESFEQDPFDTSARDKQYEKVDGSGSRYAIIKVTSTNPDDDLKEYRFNFGNLRSSVVEHDNELWLYVQRNAKMVTISRPGYVTLNRYDLQTTIEAGKNYILTLSSAGKRVLMQMVQFNVTPADSKAVVTIKKSTQGAQEELFGYVDATGGTAKSMELGVYTYKVVAPNYHTTEGRLVLKDVKQNYVEQVTLRPNFSKMTFSVDSDADIYVNGEKRGTRIWSGILKAGNYQVECKQKNHLPTTQYINVEENDDRTIKLKSPEPILGTLALTSNPLGANIMIDGKDYGKTPQNLQVLIGTHKIVVSKADYKTEEQTVEIKENQISTADFVLSQTTKMTIKTSVDGATLYLNGKSMGKTPYSGELGSGDYLVRITKEGYNNVVKRMHFDSSTPDIMLRLSRQSFKKYSFYTQFSAEAGSTMAVGGSLGGYIRKFNLEGEGLYYLDKVEFYDNSTDAQKVSMSAYAAAFKMGYAIRLASHFRLTPQVGFKYIMFNGGGWSSNNCALTVGGRLEYAVTPHFGLSLTPEGQMVLNKDDVAKQVWEISTKMKSILSGFQARLGIYFSL